MRNALLILLVAAMVAGAPLVAADGEGNFDRTLSVTGPVDLDVQTGSGHIKVHSGGSSTVVIHATIRAQDRFFGSANARERIHAIETHPPILQTGNSIPGSVVVDGIHGPVNAETGSGSVTISKVGDEVRAHTGSGRMELESINGSLDAHTGSGSIRASGVAGRIVADTGSGGVQVEQTASGDIRAHTGSGGVTVHAPQTGFELRAHTGSGSITVDRPMTVQGTIGKHDLMAKVGGGGSAIVDVSTGSGSIRIQ